MPTNTESLNRELFRLLSKYKPKPLDAEGKATPVPEEADVFKFEFTKDGEEYGTVYVTLDDERVLTVYFGDDVSDSPGDKTPGLDYDDTWSGLLHQLSSWRMTKGLRGFKTQNKDRVSDDMARRNHMRNKDKIAEGYYATGKKSSYSDAVPSVKIVIEHSRVIEEGEQRYRNINRIFLENQAGERYLLDTKKPGIARVYARHIAEGGKVNDDRWSHIGNLCEEYQKMAGFVRATRNGQFNESAQSLVNEGIEHYVSLRESLSRMTGKRGYNSYFESWTPPLMEDGTEENNLNELFVQETLDPRIESVMPILNRIHKKVSESVVDKEMNKLAEWADSLVEGEGESIQSNNSIGIPESLDQYSPVTQAITRRILSQHPDLLQKHGPEKVGDAIDSVAEFVGDVEEIGSSDVSGWVKQVAQSLGGNEGVEESALQAWLGDKKYGEKGMDALRDAGRKHVGKTKMQKIRAQFSNKEDPVSEEVDTGQYDAVKPISNSGTTPEQEKEFRKKVQAYGKELDQRQKEKEKGVVENTGREMTNTPRDRLISRMSPSVDNDVLLQKVGKVVNSPEFNSDAILKIVDAGNTMKHPVGRYIQKEFDELQYDLGRAYEDHPEEVAEKLLAMLIDRTQQGMAEGSHEDQVASLAGYNEKMAGENPPIDLGLREVGNWAKVGHYGDPIKTAWLNIAKYGVRNNRFKDSVDQVMSAIGEFPDLEDEVYDMYDINQDEVDILSDAYETVYDQWEQSKSQQGVAEAIRPDVMRHQGDKTIKIVKRAGKPIGEIGIDAEASSGIGSYYVKMYDGSYDAVGFHTAEEALGELKDIIKQTMSEDLDANQKRVGQLGPTGGPAKPGDLVGANENFINMDAQAVTSEGEHTQHAMRGRNPGANEFEHDFEPEDKIGNIHDKISKMLKRLEKPKNEPNMKDTDLGSTVLESEERPYVCVHAKKGKCEVKASSSYQAAQKAAQKWGLKGTAGIDAHLADVKKDTSSLEESTDELARILTIMNHRR